MVDAAATLKAHAGQQSGIVSSSTELVVRILPAKADSIPAYARFASGALVAPAQSPTWVESWSTHSPGPCLIAFVEQGGRHVMALPLEVVASHGVRVARFMGGKHANGNFAPVDPVFAQTADAATVAMLMRAVGLALPGVDVIYLERQALAEAGIDNPFARLPHRQSPNLALAADLSLGFEALLDRLSGKRKRKKWRGQKRKFETSGGFRIVEAATPIEVRRLLQAFFAMKTSRFAGKGIENVFAPAQVRAFFETLFTSALTLSSKPYRLFGLEVEGKLRAVNGCSLMGERIVCEFGAIADDELSIASPGDFLFYETIRDAAAGGFTLYDFSVGDEPYKRQWCDVEIRQFDSLFALTVKGRLLALQLRATASAKRLIKENRFVWDLLKRWRARKAVPPPVNE